MSVKNIPPCTGGWYSSSNTHLHSPVLGYTDCRFYHRRITYIIIIIGIILIIDAISNGTGLISLAMDRLIHLT